MPRGGATAKAEVRTEAPVLKEGERDADGRLVNSLRMRMEEVAQDARGFREFDETEEARRFREAIASL